MSRELSGCESPWSRFAFYVGDGFHYLGEDIKGVMAILSGQAKVPAAEQPPALSPQELLERIEQLQEALRGQQLESSSFEQQLNSLKQMVRISQHQQQQIAQELSTLSGVLRGQ